VPYLYGRRTVITQLVIGEGEVGTALAKHLGCHSRDLEDPGTLLEEYDVVHIAYRWSNKFVHQTQIYAEQYSAGLVVVHSTVPMGTCDSQGWVHSPVRGKHPDLLAGVETFKKHFGGAQAQQAADLLDQWWPHSQIHSKAATTEAGKLYELVQYGMEIMMEKEIYNFCEHYDLPFEEVYTQFGNSYNDGWEWLAHYEFCKPVLKHVPGPVGGHCVIAGARMLQDSDPGEYGLAAAVVELNEQLEEKARNGDLW
jgi:UDP-N-acetyl-D-mannosaminuronate dehydrogenase